MYMSLYNTNDYNVYLEIPDEFDVLLFPITSSHFDNLDDYTKNLTIPNENSVIVLWGSVHRIYPDSPYMLELNKFYHSIKNPLVIFTGILDIPKPNHLDYHCHGIDIFRHITKIDHPSNRPITLNKPLKYLFMSTKDYISRRYLLQHLLNNGFKDQGIIAYKCLSNMFNKENYKKHRDDILNICATIESQIPIIGFDEPPGNYHGVPESVINDTYLSIITETYFEGPIYFSEKIYYAMMYNHFFIYLGPPHSLKYLRFLGFKTFSHIIDESYDDVEDSAERLFAVTQAMVNFLKIPLDTLHQLYAENIDIINHNRKLVGEIDVNALVIDAIQTAKLIR